MKSLFAIISIGAAGSLIAFTQPALTIYNQNFAVVRDTVRLDLKSGTNEVHFADVTAQLEPDSVILRDPAGKHSLQIIEQNYRNDPVSEPLLLSLFEGKTIDFQNERMKDNSPVYEIIPGKIIRSGYVLGGGGFEQPIVEIKDKLQFKLPGTPLFPSLGDDTVLKPTLNWLLQSDQSGAFEAEVSYVTGGFTWEANYNLVSPEKGDTVDLIGWITMNNYSGKTFRDAKIKLMAGDVNKIRPQIATMGVSRGRGGGGGRPTVTEKSFDEYHLYTVARPTTLRDREIKQVEFVRAANVKARIIYVYDGVDANCRFSGGLNEDRNYGVQSAKKVWVVREFANAETNHLGIALPKGKLRFYRRSDDSRVEFIGEDTIDHTPRDEIVRVTTGNSFDLVGERKQTDFKLYFANPPAGTIDPNTGLPVAVAIDPNTGLPATTSSATKTNVPNNLSPPPWIDESFEIKLRNHKKTPAEIRIVEHLYRWSNWEITKKSDDFKKTDAQTVEFRVRVKPDEEKTVSYTVHYTW